MAARKINFGLLVGSASILVAAGLLGAFMRPEKEPDQRLVNRFGDVVWNHEQHARMKEIATCTVCHHTEDKQGNMSPKPCRDCHRPGDNQEALLMADFFAGREPEKVKYEGENGPPSLTAFHGKCTGCHQAMKQGPTVCRDCHEQRFSGSQGMVAWDHRTHARKIDMNDRPGLEDNCLHCHHYDEQAETDGDYRPCGACHKPAAAMGLKAATGIADHEKFRESGQGSVAIEHGQCQTCHSDFNPEDDRRSCQHCHQGWRVDAKAGGGAADSQAARPTLEQAVHERCRECHNASYSELEAAMPIHCSDCHAPDPSWLEVPGVGNVLWDHRKHGEFGGVTCDKCHHTDAPDAPHMACRSCHDAEKFENPSLGEALTKSCLGCHREEKIGLAEWPLMATAKPDLSLYRFDGEKGTFWWDHRFHAIGASLSCVECHHNALQENGVYVTARRVDAEWSEQERAVQGCRSCHGPEGANPDGAAAGTRAGSIGEVYEKLCVRCHVELGNEPSTWPAFFRLEPLEAEKVVP